MKASTEGSSDFNKLWADLMAGGKLPQHGAMGGQVSSTSGAQAHPVKPHAPVTLASQAPVTPASNPPVSQHQPAQLSVDEVK
jgi:hypothetical protein